MMTQCNGQTEKWQGTQTYSDIGKQTDLNVHSTSILLKEFGNFQTCKLKLKAVLLNSEPNNTKFLDKDQFGGNNI